MLLTPCKVNDSDAYNVVGILPSFNEPFDKPEDGFLLWADLETSQLDYSTGEILQIVVILSDKKASKLYGGWNFTVAQSDRVVGQADTWVKENLPDLLENSLTNLWRARYAIIDVTIDEWLNTFDCGLPGATNGPMLAGNSVWFDRAFIKRFLPKLYSRLHYRQLDVTSLQTFMHSAAPNHVETLLKFEKKKRHEAYSDVMESISQYRHYMRYLQFLSE